MDDTPPSAQEEDEAASSRGRASGRDVVRAAKRHIGTRYGYATCTASQMSCTCLTKKAYAPFGRNLPMTEKPSEKFHRRANRLTINLVIAAYMNASPLSGTLS